MGLGLCYDFENFLSSFFVLDDLSFNAGSCACDSVFFEVLVLDVIYGFDLLIVIHVDEDILIESY